MDRPKNPFRRGSVLWSVMEGGLQGEFDGLPGWEDLTTEEIAQVLGHNQQSVSTSICIIRRKTGYRVPHVDGRRRRRIDVVSVCKNCGAEIDWMRMEDGRYIPVDPEPVFVVEGEGDERFYDGELGEITGRLARPEEVRTKEDKINALVGFVPHWRTCPARR